MRVLFYFTKDGSEHMTEFYYNLIIVLKKKKTLRITMKALVVIMLISTIYMINT